MSDGAERRLVVEAMPRKPTSIDEYLATLDGPVRATLARLRKTIHLAVPEAEECISYGMPAFRVPGGVVAGFAARARGGSYYPFSGSTLAALRRDLDGYEGTRSALHFGVGEPLPASLVRKLVRTRLAEIAPGDHARRTPAPITRSRR